MILAIGNSGAYEVDAFRDVVKSLRRRGHDAVLFKQDKCLQGEAFVFEIHGGQLMYSVVVDGVRWNVDDFTAVWYMKPHLPRELLSYEPADYRQLLDRQFQAMRHALWSVLRHKKWLSDPFMMVEAENKIYQLKMAANAQLTIPDTLITSDPDLVRGFYARHAGKIVVKLLAVSPILGQVIYTNRVTPEYLAQIDSVKMSPAIFQALVPKAYELRITIVGDKIFTAKILSQDDEATALDWRRKPKLNDYEVRMETTLLPKTVEQHLMSFMGLLQLQFGCIDMIVTPDNEHVFLEVNPNGQWYFVQLRTGSLIADAIADLLTREVSITR